MARLTIAAWLSGLGAGDVLRAYRVLRVAHGNAFLVRRRYLRNGAIVEMRGAGVDEETRRSTQSAAGPTSTPSVSD